MKVEFLRELTSLKNFAGIHFTVAIGIVISVCLSSSVLDFSFIKLCALHVVKGKGIGRIIEVQ